MPTKHKPPPANKVIANAKMLALIERLATRGARESGIALALNISIPTWISLKRRDPRVAAALGRGVEALHDRLVADCLRMADKNNIVAPLFLLKSRYGYTEGTDQGEARPQIVINLPGALPLQKFKTIEQEPVPALPAPKVRCA